MAYPTIDKPYGYKPVNLIGGQVFAGSTRQYPIPYAYSVNLFYGDPVTIQTAAAATVGGLVTQAGAVNTTNTIVGIFLGCSFTNPSTKQKVFSQYWPASTAAGDAIAYVADDPDVVLQCAVTTGAALTGIGSGSALLVGSNLAGTTLTTSGSTVTGNGVSGVVAASANTANAGFRVLGLVPDTQIRTSCTYVSGGAAAATSVVVSGLTVGQVLPVGTDVYNLVSGQLQYTGSTLSSSSTVTTTGSTTLTITAVQTAVASGTVVLVQSPEVLVKLNFGVHRYYVV
jgi:hypothetical protein